MAIQLRRGDYEDFDPQKMRPAEVGVVQHNDPNTSDGKAVYVAINPGDVKRLVSDIEVQDVIYNETGEIINQIEQGVADTVAQAEAWVTGEVDGEPVPSTNPAYNNNAKYYAEQAEAAAQTLVIDSAPTQGSAHAVSSGGVYDAIKNIAPDRKYLFVGDSYAEGYSHDGNNSGWCMYLVNYLGLTTDEYEIVYHGGWGFANGGYTALLDNATGSGFTDVVVCGGYNDNAYSEAQISGGIEAFKNKALGKWPNATIHIGFIAYNKEGNGTGAVDEWSKKRKALFDVVLPTYQKCTVFGCSYLNNVECWLREDGLTPSDGYHPNAEGNQAIAKAVANALITGSAPLPNERYEITDDIKKALLQCFEKIAWKDNTGRTSFLELANALHVKISDRREELPDTYEQVEFIKSTRAQYIALTDVLTQIPIDIRVKASLETADDRTGGYLVSALGSGTQRFYAVTYTNSKIAARIGNNGWTEVTVTDEVVIGQPYQIETSISYASGGDANLVVKYNLGQQSAVLTAQSISGVDGHTLALFASDASGGTRGVWALYEIVIYSGQTKIFDGIPCYRKSDNKTGLFDAVSNSFYPNATTTEFVVGNVVE